MNEKTLQSTLGTFLDMHIQDTLYVRRSTVKITPTRNLIVRHDMMSKKIYISQSIFHGWLRKNGLDILEVVRGLMKSGVIEDAGLVCLGKGSMYDGLPQLAYTINLSLEGQE